jgi:hypothetical protein
MSCENGRVERPDVGEFMADTQRPGPGRPPLVGDPPARVHVTVPSADYDRAYVVAQREGISVPQLLRRGLRRELHDHDADDS